MNPSVRRPLIDFVALVGAFSLFASMGCRSQPPDPSAQTQKPAASPATPVEIDASPLPPQDAGTDSSTARKDEVPTEELAGALLTKEIQAAFRVAACGGDDANIPPKIARKIIDAHCKALEPAFAEYKREWLDVAGPFIAKLRPEKLPATVVYPFGGGDLVSALATYPDGVEFTTISLEVAGDARGILRTDGPRIERELRTLRDHLAKLFLKAHSRTENLDIETRGAVPGEIAFTMAALAIHGYEPVTLRYFDFQPDGALRFFTEEDFAKLDAKADKGGKKAFPNAEIRFRKPGDSKVKILRHVAYDLSDANLKKSPGLLKHLQAKGKVSTMTKAASHLLWDDANFGTIRDWLMTNTDWMISDTTGVPPRIAKKYGFEQDVYGQYEWPEPFGTVNNKDAADFKNLFKGSAPISFRYGYPDNKSHGHVVVTHKPGVTAAHP